MMNYNEYLVAHRIRPNRRRVAVLEYLDKNRTHPTVDDIYSHLAPTMPSLSRTTIYNILHLFTEREAIQMLTIDERRVCFDRETKPHPHFFCKSCERVFDIPEEDIKIQSEKIDGFIVTEEHMYFKGYCKDCIANKKVVLPI